MRELEAQIEAALLPLIFQGLCSAYRLSEKGVDEIHCRIKGVDKKNIAKTVYRMLPEKIGESDLSVVKTVVTQERFETLDLQDVEGCVADAGEGDI